MRISTINRTKHKEQINCENTIMCTCTRKNNRKNTIKNTIRTYKHLKYRNSLWRRLKISCVWYKIICRYASDHAWLQIQIANILLKRLTANEIKPVLLHLYGWKHRIYAVTAAKKAQMELAGHNHWKYKPETSGNGIS